MPCSNRLLCAAVTVAALAFLPVRAQSAENKAGSVELGVTSTFIHYDSETDLANDIGWTGFVHYNFTPRHGGELTYTVSTTDPKSGPTFPVDYSVIKAGYVYTTTRRERLYPFFRVGLGWWSTDVPGNVVTPIGRLQGDDEHYLIYSGGGVRIAITDWIGMKLAAGVDILSVEGGLAHPDVQGTGELGVYFKFGGRSASETPAEEKKEEAIPVEPPKEGSTEDKPPAESKPPTS